MLPAAVFSGVTRARRRLGRILCTGLVLSACTQPVFNAGLTQTTALTRDWDPVGTLQVVDAADAFLPDGFFRSTWYPRSEASSEARGLMVFSDDFQVLRLLVTDQSSVRLTNSGSTEGFLLGTPSEVAYPQVLPFYSGNSGLPDRYVVVLVGPNWPDGDVLILGGVDGAPPDTPFTADFSILHFVNSLVQANEDGGLPTGTEELWVIGLGAMRWGLASGSGDPELIIPLLTRNVDGADPVRNNEVYEGLLRVRPDGTSEYTEVNQRNNYLDLLQPDAGGNPSGVLVEDTIRYVVDSAGGWSYLSAAFFPNDPDSGEVNFQARDDRVLYWRHSGPTGPAGVDTPVNGIAVGSRVEALLPDGSVVLSEPGEGLWYRFLPDDRAVSEPIAAPGLEVIGQFPLDGARERKYLVQQTISASIGGDIIALTIRSYLVSGNQLIDLFAE